MDCPPCEWFSGCDTTWWWGESQAPESPSQQKYLCQSIDAWSVFIDLGCVSVLLLIGFAIRTASVWAQRLFLPASVIAGFGGLACGPNGLDILPFSILLPQYPSVLITLVFAALPFTSRSVSGETGSRRAAELGSYSAAIVLLQWGLGVLFSLTVLSFVWPDLPRGFGTILASGFVGGHGTAAALGAAFNGLGEQSWSEAGALAMTSATVGILSAVVGGMLWVQWAARNGTTRFLARFDDLPDEFRTGRVPDTRRRPLGYETLSPLALDPLIFHVALVVTAAFGGYLLTGLGSVYMGAYRPPSFCLAFVCGFGLRWLCTRLRFADTVDRTIMLRLSGALTDVLVVCGIAAVSLEVVARQALPLLALFVFGLALCWAVFYIGGPRIFRDLWFEKALFTWGWVTGVMAIALALLRVVDPRDESEILDPFARAYLFVAPLEVGLVSFAPLLIAQGFAWSFVGGDRPRRFCRPAVGRVEKYDTRIVKQPVSPWGRSRSSLSRRLTWTRWHAHMNYQKFTLFIGNYISINLNERKSTISTT